ncbi:DUF859 family phage minor structural protein [Streptococcus sp. NLN64]|uniref:DUF859 family phage minor structural protein n=1 Tax=Streptococcus sp. NLN64 TaxID=2822799 RepID=UPI0018CB90A9|nr:DUF859 family phage minor structural protein [Streptococcus sp. NLN64]MBG9366563.1 hypothetical protein [Streptococcus sp. NLN64]
MAEFWSNDDRGFRLRVWLDTTSQDVEANTSQIRVRAHLLNRGWTFTGYQINASVTVDGQTVSYSGSPAMLSNNSSIQLIDKTITVTHNDDGSKTANMTARLQGGGGYSPNTLTIGQQGYKLADIARASSATVPSGVIGSQMTITIQPVKAGYTHTVRYEFGSKSGTIASNVATSANWTPPMDLCDLYPNATTGTGQIHVDTYSGGRKLGTRSFATNVTIPDSVKPTLSNFSLSEGSDVVKRKLPDGPFVQILSKVKVNFGVAHGVRGSTITGYKAVVLGSNQTVTENNGTFGVIDRSGEVTIRATVIDSRGRESAPVDKKVRFEPYHAPILSFSVKRTGALQDVLNINRNAKVASLGNKNRMKLRFFAAKGLSSNFSAANGSAAGEWTSTFEFINAEAQLTGSYSGTSSWTIKGVLEDSFTSTEFVYQVPPEQVVLSYTPDGVGIKKPWERGAVDVAGDVFVNNRMIQMTALTDKDGTLFEKGRITGNPNNPWVTDLNLVTTTGFYWCTNSAKNLPISSWGLLQAFRTQRGSDKWETTQQFTSTDLRVFVRNCNNSGIWKSWREIGAEKPEPPKPQWVELQEGVSVKRIGEIVTIKLVEIKLAKGTDMRFTPLPEEYRPPYRIMENIAMWTVNNEIAKLQIQETGDWSFLGGTIRNNYVVNAQITFTV